MIVPEPGRPDGPCLNRKCGHVYCTMLRCYAEQCCVLCNQPVGFETSFFEFHDEQVVHTHCPPLPSAVLPNPSLWQRLTNRLRGEAR